jgi:AcrR family transcriptional regulator
MTRSRRPQRRRDEVLDVAARVFAERGFEGTTIQDIADRLGILKGSLYYYIDSKEHLLYELIADVWTGALELLAEVRASEDDPVTQLRELVRRHVAYVGTNVAKASLFLHELQSLTGKHRRVVFRQLSDYERGVTEIVQAAQQQGTLRSDVDPHLVTMALLGASNWLSPWYGSRTRVVPEDVGEQYASMLVDGLLVGAVSSR